MQGNRGIHVEEPRQVDHREEDVAQLCLDLGRAAGAHRGAQLTQFLVDLVPYRLRAGPVEPDFCRLLLELCRLFQRRE